MAREGLRCKLVLEEQHIEGGEIFEDVCEVIRQEGEVCSGGNGDTVVAGIVDEDESDTRGLIRVGAGAGRVDAFCAHAIEDARAVRVGTDGCDQRNGSTGAASGHGLIGAFAAHGLLKRATGDGFAAGRQVRDAGDEIDIGTADDENAAGVRQV